MAKWVPSMEDTDRQKISLAVSKQIWSHERERERESMNMNTFIVTIMIRWWWFLPSTWHRIQPPSLNQQLVIFFLLGIRGHPSYHQMSGANRNIWPSEGTGKTWQPPDGKNMETWMGLKMSGKHLRNIWNHISLGPQCMYKLCDISRSERFWGNTIHTHHLTSQFDLYIWLVSFTTF